MNNPQPKKRDFARLQIHVKGGGVLTLANKVAPGKYIPMEYTFATISRRVPQSALVANDGEVYEIDPETAAHFKIGGHDPDTMLLWCPLR